MINQNEDRRLASLDVFRGITVAGMILVNNEPGETFTPLAHSEWNGMTPCDLVFPFFLYIMGVSTFLSLRKTGFQPSLGAVRKIAKRTILIFLIGLAINWLANAVGGDWSLGHLRIMAVLQRIAICYCAVALMAIFVNHRYFLHISFALLAAYTVILLLGNGYATDESNIALRIDKAILGDSHLYRHSPIDPEGLLGTIAAIAHALIGFWCGRAIVQAQDASAKVTNALIPGACLVLGGYLLSYALPPNKSIWSPSFVLLTTGLASLLLGILIHAIDTRNHSRWTRPFLVFGVNPLFLYTLSEVMAIVGWQTGLYEMLWDGLIRTFVTNSRWASLCFALTIVAICGAAGSWLYKHKLFIKI